MKEGKIVKAISGFYYVQAKNHVYPCKGRGVFRKKGISPLVGDYVLFDPKEKYITEIYSRRNSLDRPPIANIDQVLIISSAKEPEFSSLLLDRFLVMIESRNIQPIIFINKIDLVSKEEKVTFFNQVQAYYQQIGYPTELVSSLEHIQLPSLKHYFHDKTTVIAGQSGVGKSSLLNRLNPTLLIETDKISERLGRGKHTTRHVELLEVSGGLIADTPGFSTVDFSHVELDQLTNYFPEMRQLKGYCKFRGCLHHKEPHCAVKRAVTENKIKQERYEHYLSFLTEIQERKPRYS